MSRDPRRRTDVALLLIVVVLVFGIALGVLEAVRPAFELDLESTTTTVQP